jgi:YD repeat-containing protein
LDRSQGHIGYSTVFEKRSDGSYTKYEFTNAGPGANDAAPFYETPTPAFEDKASYTNNSFKRGLNKNLYQYNSSGTEVSRTENKYQDQFDDYSRYIRSVRLKRGDQATGAGFRVTAYPQYYFPNMLRVKKEVVSSSSGSISNEVSYVYDAQNRVITETSKNSLSEIVSTSYMYPNDFSVSSPYGEMVTRNIISPVIGQTTTNVTLGKELAKSRTNYSFWAGSQFIRPASIQKSVSGNVLETSATINAYDEKGNILQKTDKNGAIVSLFWGYNQQYPVAKVEGKSYQDALTQSGINLSVINNPSATDQNMRIELDRLRLLTNCFVTTYTYKPLVGMTSETDPNGKTVYFEYDQFNRLSLVRDQDNNIVKKVCYNFFGKPEDCPIQTNTLPVWRPTGNTRCQPCPANSSYNSGLKEKEERDINPNSATVGTTRWVVDASLGTCPSPADWVNGFAYCEQASVSPFGYTGNQVITQVDANPCSPTYNETHLLIIPNNAACPVCSSACNTPSQKCINGVCVTGTWSIIKTKKIGKTGPWECTYAYCFPDGTISSYTQVVTSSTACTIACY